VDYELAAERWIDGVVAALQRQEVVSAWPDIERKFPELGTVS
jgi:hypothetical protein